MVRTYLEKMSQGPAARGGFRLSHALEEGLAPLAFALPRAKSPADSFPAASLSTMRTAADGQGLWAETAPPAPETSALSGALEADVAIVGGGFTGLSAALHLAESGVKTIVLEAGNIGHGGSGRNVGLVNAGMWVMPDEVPRILGEDRGERLLSLLGEAPRVVFELIEKHAIDCEAERAGTLHCAVGPKGLREIEERARQWQARGAPVRLLSAAEAAEKLGTEAYA